MDTNEYLAKVLEQKALTEDSVEVQEMKKHRDDVEQLIVEAFKDSEPTIDFGGSYAKGTMNKDSYDLDIVCYFPREDSDPGDTLKEIYNNVLNALSDKYWILEKTSALRLRSKEPDSLGQDFHIDVVPGRYVDDSHTDAYLHINKGNKSWLKTNLRKHILFISKSNAVETIRLAKLWNYRAGLGIRTFVLELLVVKALNGSDELKLGLSASISKFWDYLRDHRNELAVEDPANSGNDLSDLIDSVRDHLCDAAETALQQANGGRWQTIFGALETKQPSRIEILNSTAGLYSAAGKPWADNSSDN